MHYIHIVPVGLFKQLDTISPSESLLYDVQSDPDDLNIFQAASQRILGPENSEFGDYARAMRLPEIDPDMGLYTNEISVMDVPWDDTTAADFKGACVDSGAQKTLIWKPQTEAYCALLNMDLMDFLKFIKLTFTIGESKHNGVINITMRIPSLMTYSSLSVLFSFM